MKSKVVLTTGDVCAHCHVSYQTVHDWIKTGKLEAYCTPGRHQRIHVIDFREFLRRYDMPAFDGPAPEPGSPRKRVLVVDDDPEVVKVICQALGRTGLYELASAPNGFNAGLEVSRFRPDLLLLDLMMPYIDGFEVCRTVKSDPDTKHMLVLVVTGFAQEEFIRQALECGADGWLAKPFKMAQLTQSVEALLSKKTSRISA